MSVPDLKADDTVSTRAPDVGEDRRAEGSVGIDHHVSVAVFRQGDDLRLLVVAKLDPAQVRLDYLVEDSLVVAHDDKLPSASAPRGCRRDPRRSRSGLLRHR